jgi:phosphatidylglycerol---prolipoprotein diacylglyceryl transferase
VLPEIDLGPITLQSFGLMLGVAFLCSGILAQRFLVELGHPADWAYEMVFAALVGGIVGARVWSVVENWGEAKEDLLGSIFSGTGLVFYGGAIGGALAVALWAWRRGVFGPRMFDVAAPSLAVGYAVGRIGCQLAGDGDYGVAWDGPWAMAYPDGTVPTTEEVHPTPVYEVLVMGLVTWFLWRMRHRVAPGGLFALWLLLAGGERFLVEFIRRNEPAVAGLTVAQLVSLAMIAGGLVWLARLRGARPAAATVTARG